jgi:hypothetical protein
LYRKTFLTSTAAGIEIAFVERLSQQEETKQEFDEQPDRNCTWGS